MKSYEAKAMIDAPPDRVWEVLVDTSSWPDWVENVESIDGHLVQGESITVHAVRASYKDVSAVVEVVDPPRSLRLGGTAYLGAFRFSRQYSLEPAGGSATAFTIREEHTGPLAGPAAKRTGDLQPWFEGFAERLKTRAEDHT